VALALDAHPVGTARCSPRTCPAATEEGVIVKLFVLIVILVLLVLVGAVLGYGPSSLRANYARDVASMLPHDSDEALVTERDLADLPPVLQRYLRLTGTVGQPRVHDYRAHFRGRIRSGPRAAWMTFDAEQTSSCDPPARLFLMNAWMSGLPVVAFHRYVGPAATLQVKLLGLVPVANAAGPQLDESETVTLFNDMCLLAPAALLDPAIRWSEAGPDTVRATYTHAGHTIRADLVFDAAGELVDFVSDDRAAGSADGRSFTPMRWSTPVSGYHTFGAHRLFTRGAAVWHAADGPYDYLQLELLDIAYNVSGH
jgi:hypothetical protein